MCSWNCSYKSSGSGTKSICEKFKLLFENWQKLDNSHLTAIQFLHEMNNMKYQDELINENWSLNFSRIDLEPEEEDLEEEQFEEHIAELSF